jgi:hypothetical protein
MGRLKMPDVVFEKFELNKEVVTYSCGCKWEGFSFEKSTPSSHCEKHGGLVSSLEKFNDEL